ncbi:hypothetical protein ACNFBR_15600 [Pseudomonas sp. NY11955]|uniref:hypothetical protein n=1 Tax=Pseudomonas sp. NY11955 TaxID=3400363 RepID=UPI003A837911
MKRLSNFLMTNPIVVVGMFVLTLLSAIAGLILGWEVLYRDYLSKSLSVPAWLIVLIVISAFFGWILYGTRINRTQAKELVLVADKTFGTEQVVVSGKRFVKCKFHHSEMVLDGQDRFDFDSCEFHDPRFTFIGPAGQALGTLTSMFKDPAFRPVVEGLFLNIRAGKLPIAVEPSGGR